MKRILIDAETSPLLVCSWNVGRKISLSPENIVAERKIICLCWKVEGSPKVYSLRWKNQDDGAILREFVKVIADADEIVGHNIRAYDLPWIKARCAFHRIPTMPSYPIVDTLTIARRNFKFVSNRLDYLGKFLGFGGKMDTGGFGLWKDVVLGKSEAALDKMVKYCKRDILLLESVYHRLAEVVPQKTHEGVSQGKENWTCAHCGSVKVRTSKTNISAKGIKSYQMNCSSCHRFYSISQSSHDKYLAR